MHDTDVLIIINCSSRHFSSVQSWVVLEECCGIFKLSSLAPKPRSQMMMTPWLMIWVMILGSQDQNHSSLVWTACLAFWWQSRSVLSGQHRSPTANCLAGSESAQAGLHHWPLALFETSVFLSGNFPNSWISINSHHPLHLSASCASFLDWIVVELMLSYLALIASAAATICINMQYKPATGRFSTFPLNSSSLFILVVEKKGFSCGLLPLFLLIGCWCPKVLAGRELGADVFWVLDRPKAHSIKHGEDIMMRYWSTLRERQLQKEAPPSAVSTKKRGLKPSDLQFIEGPVLRSECQTVELLEVERKFPPYAASMATVASCMHSHKLKALHPSASVSVSRHGFELFPQAFSYNFGFLDWFPAASLCIILMWYVDAMQTRPRTHGHQKCGQWPCAFGSQNLRHAGWCCGILEIEARAWSQQLQEGKVTSCVTWTNNFNQCQMWMSFWWDGRSSLYCLLVLSLLCLTLAEVMWATCYSRPYPPWSSVWNALATNTSATQYHGMIGLNEFPFKFQMVLVLKKNTIRLLASSNNMMDDET